MIRAGECFCHHCGKTRSEAFYKTGDRAGGVWLRHKGHRYELEYDDFKKETREANKNRNPHDIVELSMDFPADCDGTPQEIRVRFKGEKSDVIMERACPVCAEGTELSEPTNRPLFMNLGKHPLYVIAMVGNRSTGKSTFLKALAYPTNIAAVDRAGYPFRLQFRTLTGKDDSESKATEAKDRGHTKFLEVCKDRDVIAHVLLLDLSGELYESKIELVWQLIGKNTSHGGADAFIFVEPAPMDGAKSQNKKNFDSLNILQSGHARGEFDEKPIAFVYTHLDELLEQNQVRTISGNYPGDEIPLLTEHSFADNADRKRYAPEKLIPRIALENFVARSYSPSVLEMNRGENAKGFLVQSCKPYEVPAEDGTSERDDDFGQTLNVMDPLLWTLNKLGIFPLMPMEE